ncbi:MAG TPA: hypothetical protein VGM30_10340 [Puia sp.]|jgi:hypothetical protein
MKNYLLFALLLVGATSCNPLQKVLRDPAKLQAAGRQWEKSNPCVVDSVTTFLPGKETVVIDSSAYRAYRDSILSQKLIVLGPDCARYQHLFDSLSRRAPVVITALKTFHDTLEVAKRDMRHEKILGDSVDYYTGQTILFRGEFNESQQQLKEKANELLKAKAKFILWVTILLIVLVGSHILRSYIKLPFL